MNISKILIPCGAVGSGIDDEAFRLGMEMKPDCIASDAGSTDSGPAYLAKGVCKYSRKSIEHDLNLTVTAALENHIPLLIGTCGTCGTDSSLQVFVDITKQIMEKKNLHGKIAVISSQMDPAVLEQKYDQGRIRALPGAPEISRETFASCSNIVGLIGAEPYIEALKNGADIILAGRSTDTAVIAAFPLMQGGNVGACWHGAKVTECGAQCADTSGICIMLEVDQEGFTVYPTVPGAKCTPYTVSAHLLYENTNPFRLTEPAGSFLTEHAVYTQISECATRVTGSEFDHAAVYTMKLEGARCVGYQNISLVGVADPDVIANLPAWLRNMRHYVQGILDRHGFDRGTYSFDFKCYGYDAVVPRMPDETALPREIGLLFTVTADTQEIATLVAKEFNPYLLHFPVDVTSSRDLLPTFAFPFSPVDTPRGPVYEFVLHHVVEVDDPLELVRIRYTEG